MDAVSLVKIYPWLDTLMAETLIKSHENGTLAKHLESLPETERPQSTSSIISGAVVITNPEIKIEVV